ncbi:Cro/CI family transcriptional regulator [Pseudomonas sp. CFII64]|jgi:transcriptional regulator with XRE-family HTH domain|nr:Cro/CI family transcriptional regulator [Pseudomonas sp. CFII64]
MVAFMSSLGERLRAERHRLGFSQKRFAGLGGVKTNAQGNYESNQRIPNARYLTAIGAEGADVLYIVTGDRTPLSMACLDPQEEGIVRSYRALDTTSQNALEKLSNVLYRAVTSRPEDERHSA